MPEEIPSADIRWLGRLLSATILYTFKKVTPQQACEIADELATNLEPSLDYNAWAQRNVPIAKPWIAGIKYLTGEARRARAEKKFLDLLKRAGISETCAEVVHPTLNSHLMVTRKIQDWRERGFTEAELQFFAEKFDSHKKSAWRAEKAIEIKRTARKTAKPAKR